MCHQLVRDGQQVGLLGLFDTALPGAEKPLPLKNRLQYHWKRIRQDGPNYLLDKARTKVQDLNNQLQRTYGTLARKWGLPMPHSIEYFAMREMYEQGVEEYTPQPYSGKITIFRASDREDAETSYMDPLLGWGDLATGGIEVFDIAGGHLGILEEPTVSQLGAQLQVCLDQAGK